jgi:hypothetical protein
VPRSEESKEGRDSVTRRAGRAFEREEKKEKKKERRKEKKDESLLMME